MKTFSPVYPGKINVCALRWLVSARFRFLQNDLNAAVEISLQNACALFFCFLRASERRGKRITTDSCGLYFGHQSFNSDFSNEVSIRGHAERCSAVIMPAELLLQIGVTQLLYQSQKEAITIFRL